MRPIGTLLIIFGGLGALYALVFMGQAAPGGDTLNIGLISDREVAVTFWGLMCLAGWIALGFGVIEHAITCLPGYVSSKKKGKPFHVIVQDAAGVKLEPAEDRV